MSSQAPTSSLKRTMLTLVASEETAVPSSEGVAGAAIQAICALSVIKKDLADELPDWPLYSGHLKSLGELEDLLVSQLVKQRGVLAGDALLTVAVIGDFNAGKSTFINGLLGEHLCPEDQVPTTSSITTFTWGPSLLIERELPSGQREQISREEYEQGVRHSSDGEVGDGSIRYHVQVNATVLHQLRLIDTPGFDNPKNPYDSQVTEGAAREADVLFVVFDIERGNPSAALLEQLKRLRQTYTDPPPAYLLINKAALKRSPRVRAEVLAESRRLHEHLFDKFILVDSLELTNAEEELALSMLSQTLRAVESGLYRRAEFQVSISGKKGRGANGRASYWIEAEGRAEELSFFPKADLAKRDDLLSLLEEVSLKKRDLLEARLRHLHAELTSQWTQCLTLLRDDLMSFMDEGGGHSIDTFNATIHDVFDLKNKLIFFAESFYADAYSECFELAERIEKGFFSDTTYFQLWFKPALAEPHFIEYGQEVSKIVKAFNSKIRRDHDDESLSISYDRLWRSLTEEFKQQLGELVSNFGRLVSNLGSKEGDEVAMFECSDRSLRDSLLSRMRPIADDFSSHWINSSLSTILSEFEREINVAIGAEKATIKEREDELLELCIQIENALEIKL